MTNKATLRPPNNDFFQIRSVNITMKHKTAATVDGSGRCVFWNTEDLKWSGRGCSTISSNKTHTECTVSYSLCISDPRAEADRPRTWTGKVHTSLLKIKSDIFSVTI